MRYQNPKTAGRYGSTRHFDVCAVIPPFILESIAFNATGKAAAAAKRSLLTTATLMGQRGVLAMTYHEALPPGLKQRTIYNARQGTRLPGVMVMREGAAPSIDLETTESYNGSGQTYDLLLRAFGRNSLDNLGMRLNSTVHYDRNYVNAFWNGNQMVYGDGDGDLFNRFTASVDVCGHELTHGLTQYTWAGDYEAQSGALNESMSDCFGSMVKQWVLNQDAKDADWLIGQGLFTGKVQGRALRDMLHPGTAYDDPNMGKDPQPASMDDYLQTDEDSGGVHSNSGIPNRAFASAAVLCPGKTETHVGPVWYDAMTKGLQRNSDFGDAARETIAAAVARFGAGSVVHRAVEAGWDNVKVQVKPVS